MRVSLADCSTWPEGWALTARGRHVQYAGDALAKGRRPVIVRAATVRNAETGVVELVTRHATILFEGDDWSHDDDQV